MVLNPHCVTVSYIVVATLEHHDGYKVFVSGVSWGALPSGVVRLDRVLWLRVLGTMVRNLWHIKSSLKTVTILYRCQPKMFFVWVTISSALSRFQWVVLLQHIGSNSQWPTETCTFAASIRTNFYHNLLPWQLGQGWWHQGLNSFVSVLYSTPGSVSQASLAPCSSQATTCFVWLSLCLIPSLFNGPFSRGGQMWALTGVIHGNMHVIVLSWTHLQKNMHVSK